MTTEQATATAQSELSTRAGRGATLAELLSHVERRSGRSSEDGFSPQQHDQLVIYCWALRKTQVSGLLWGKARVWGSLEEDIGA
jgi:hypothetical protein